MRTFLAGLAGGIVMFVWSSIAHVATPLGAAGVSTLPHEAETISALATSVGDHSGFFLFPSMAAAAKGETAQTGAAGLLVYRAHAVLSMNPSNLVVEFLTELAEAMILAVLLAWAAVAGFAARVGFAALAGLAAVITTNVSYWNWYGFPTDYSLVYALVEFVGYVVAGAAIALILPSK